MGADRPGRRLDLGVGRVRSAVGDVVAHRAGEQERLLRHDAELAAVRVEVEVAQVDAVDRHRARRRVVEAGDQLDERRLAGAGLAHERDGLAGRDVQVDAGDRLVARRARVAEVHVVAARTSPRTPIEHDGARRAGVPLGVSSSSSILRERRRGLLPGVEHLRELLDRREELVEVEQERDHHAGGDDTVVARARMPAPSTRDRADVGEEQHEREVERR